MVHFWQRIRIVKLLSTLVVMLLAACLLADCGAAKEKPIERTKQYGEDEEVGLKNIFGGTNILQGSGNVTTESREVSGFTEVALAGSGNLTIRQTGSDSLSIEAEDNIIPKLTSEVANGRLTLGVEPNTNLWPTKPINYELTVKDLNAIQSLGSGGIYMNSINTDVLGITNNGSGEINLANVEANNLRVASGGSGAVKTAGKVGSQVVGILGSGHYQAEDLQSQEAKVDIKGSAEATVNVTERLDARITGSGSIEYVGNPTISQQVRGSGELRRR